MHAGRGRGLVTGGSAGMLVAWSLLVGLLPAAGTVGAAGAVGGGVGGGPVAGTHPVDPTASAGTAGAVDTSATAGSLTAASAREAAGGAPSGVEAWIYPGRPGEATCEAPADLGRLSDPTPTTVKPQYLEVDNQGTVSVTTTARMPCNGYRPASVRALGRQGRQVLTTVAAGPAATAALLASAARQHAAQSAIVSFVDEAGLAGAELDFQPVTWTSSAWAAYMTFVGGLAEQLHKSGHRLEVDMNAWTATPPDTERYLDPVLQGAHVVVMSFDHQYLKACSPIAPFAWLRQVVSYVQTQVPLQDVTFGLPAYGYRARSCNSPSAVRDNVPYVAMQQAPGFPATPSAVAAHRDPSSGEVRWRSGHVRYDYVDSTSMRQKLQVLHSLGVSRVSVWALGGNPWFDANPPS